jgi:hypothetical protein
MIMSSLIVSLLAGAARAEDVSGCDKFKWSVARERGWFAANPGPASPGAADPGASLFANRAYAVALRPGAAASFSVPAEREPNPGTFAGAAIFAIDSSGLYQIALSTEAWIDVIQNGERLKAVDFSGQKACPGLRKSVRFVLTKGPATVQISNAEGDVILLAVASAP